MTQLPNRQFREEERGQKLLCLFCHSQFILSSQSYLPLTLNLHWYVQLHVSTVYNPCHHLAIYSWFINESG